ncbi:hypothetical protein Barb7_01383 [Bacteroidales bacterium Barb7]|nr:hypothetical protein Barb7_01383 [Bacteroidales bacterium Barb7]
MADVSSVLSAFTSCREFTDVCNAASAPAKSVLSLEIFNLKSVPKTSISVRVLDSCPSK